MTLHKRHQTAPNASAVLSKRFQPLESEIISEEEDECSQPSISIDNQADKWGQVRTLSVENAVNNEQREK